LLTPLLSGGISGTSGYKYLRRPDDPVVQQVTGPQFFHHRIGGIFVTGLHLNRLVEVGIKGLPDSIDSGTVMRLQDLNDLIGDHLHALTFFFDVASGRLG
jgi:hypothetical protein